MSVLVGNITYIGDIEFTEMAEGDLDNDPFGMDTLTRVFEGPTYKLHDYLKELKKLKVDREYKQLNLVHKRARRGRAYSQVTVDFAGLLGGEIPQHVESAGFDQKTIQLQSTSGTQASFTYNAPTSTFRYITKTRPTRQVFENQMMYYEASFDVVERTGARGRLYIDNGNPTSADFIARREIFGTLHSRPVGLYWENTETNEARLVEVDDMFRPRAYGGVRHLITEAA